MIFTPSSIVRWFGNKLQPSKTQQSAFFSRIVDRIRNSLELNVVLQTATDEVAQFLKLDACLFCWSSSDLQGVHVVCEYVAAGQPSYIGYYPFTTLGETKALFQTDELVVHCGQCSSCAGSLPQIANGFRQFLENLSFSRSAMHCAPTMNGQLIGTGTLSCASAINRQFSGRASSGNALNHPAQPPTASKPSLFGAKASLLIPIREPYGPSGFVVCLMNQPRHWSATELEFMQRVAQQLEIAVRQAQLYAHTQQQAIASAIQAKHLSETLENLRKTQAQLIQSEKMSSLGQMIAGLAHEINNPISFIYGNIPFVDQYVRDLVRLIEAYQTRLTQTDPALQKLTKEIELDFLLKDLPKILNSMKVGASRVRDIISTLRGFAQVDGAERQIIQLHDVIDNALFVLQNHIPPEIQVICTYGALPPIEGYPRLLSQVFMNLLINAVEALTDSTQPVKTIRIITEVKTDEVTAADWAKITIADNGCGISPEVQPKIFDPFFTTKPVGGGTGLGLAVCYQTVVHQHKGRLLVRSEPGKGTEVTVELLVKQSVLGRSDRKEPLDGEGIMPRGSEGVRG